MPDIIITPSTGKLEFIDDSVQVTRRHAFTLDPNDGLALNAPLSAAAVIAPLNVINVTVDNSNNNYPFILASGSVGTGTKTLMMDGAGGTYNPFTNLATIDISGNSATTTLASNSSQLNGQAASYYTNITARLGYTPVNKVGDTISGDLVVNGNFSVNGSFTAFSASNIYLTSSNLTVTDNILLMNALTPYQRYAGIQMYDSGSGTLSQFLWDGEGDYFFLTGSSVNGKIITGPDGQTNLTSNYIPKATAGYKLGNSLIYDNGTNVAIGTTSPAQKLDVIGNIRCVPVSSAWAEGLSFSMPDTSSWGGLRWRRERANADGNHYIGYVGTDTTDDLVFGSNNAGTQIDNNIRITKAGLVGVGTTVPSTKFHVFGNAEVGDSTADTGLIVRHGAGAAQYGRIRFYSTSTNIHTIHSFPTAWNGGTFLNASAGAMNLQGTNGITFGSWNNIDVAFAQGGNNYFKSYVGIGTSSPSYKLQVNGGATEVVGQVVASFEKQSSTDGKIATFVNTTGSGYTSYIYIGSNPGRDWKIGKNVLNVGTTGHFQITNDLNQLRMQISAADDTITFPSSSVGIGTSSPAYKFDVGVAGSDVISVRLTPGYERVRFNTFDLLGYNDGNLWMIGNNPTNTLVLGKTWDWDNQIGIAYTPGTVGNSGGILQIGQISKNNANYTHGITRLYTNGLERITIIANGNVGIGVTNPAYKLDVNGDTRLLAGGSLRLITAAGLERGTFQATDTTGGGGAGLIIQTSGGEEIVFKDSADVNMVIKGNGRVGIGTTVPTSSLHIKPQALGSDLLILERYASQAKLIYAYESAADGYLEVRNGSDQIVSKISGYATTPTYFQSNVGIGTTAPVAKFEMFGGEMAIKLSANTTSSFQWKNSSGTKIQEIRYDDGDGSMTLGGVGGYPIKFITSNTEKVRIAGDGNFGIGTTNPIYKFQVVGSAYVNNGTLYIDSGNSLTWGNSTQSILGTNDVGLSFIAGSTTRMFISSSGNVGIGTTVTAARLQVNSTTSGATLLRTDGTNGTLFSVVDDLSDSLMSVNNSAGLPVFEVFADDRIVAGQYGQNDLVVRNNKVGIGTNNPSFKLDVTGSFGVNASSLDTSWPFVVSDNSSAGSRYSLNKYGSMGFNNADNYAQLQLLGSSGAYVDFTNSIGGDSNARLIYYAGSRLDLTYGFTTTITLNSTGVGIGTTGPSGELHIYGAQPAFRIQSSVSGSMQFGQWDGTYNRIQSSARDFLLISTDATNLIFSTNTTERMRISGSGTIQLNTLATYSSLTYEPSIIYTRVGQSGIGGIYFGNSYNSNNNVGIQLRVSNDGTQVQAVTINNQGYVGIGTTLPTTPLHVVGVISGSSFSGAGTGLTGTAASLTAGTATSANALNASNNYQVNSIGVNIAGSGTAGRIGTNENGVRSWTITPTGGRLVFDSGDGNGSAIFGFPVTASTFVGAGTGLTGTAANLTVGTALNVGNGTITIAAGTGVSVGATNTFTTNQSGATTVTISNSGVTSNVAGTGISVSGATGAVTITNTGVTSITTNTGLSANASATGAVTITNTGVTSNVAGTGISLSGGTGAVTITNSGVTSAVAGTGVGVSAATGAVTFSIGQAVGTGNTPTFAGATLNGQLNVNHSVSTAIVRLWNAGSTIWSLGVNDTSGNYFNISADFGSVLINKTNGNIWISGSGINNTVLHSGTTSAPNLSIGGNAATVTTNANLTGDVTSVGNATTIASNAVTSVKIADSNVTLAKIVNISTGTILGNNGAGAAAPLALTSAQVASMLSGQTMNIAGSSTSCTGNAATATTATTANALNTGNSYTGVNFNATGYFQTTTGFLRTDDANGIEILTTTNSAQTINVKGILIGSSYDTNPPQNEIRTSNNQSLVLNARGSGQVDIYTNDSTKVTVLNGGNVGVGTSNPGRKLDVEGIVRTRGASGSGGFEIGAATTGAAKWRIEWDSASDSLDFNWVG